MRRLLPALLLTLLLLPAAASAQQPVEGLGPQLRLTNVGPDGRDDFDADTADIAYNPVRDEYLVVWQNQVPEPSFDREIFAQRLAADGTRIGVPVQVSGLAGAIATVDASQPAVAYSASLDRYAVVYTRDTIIGVQVQLQQLNGAGEVIRGDGTPGPQPLFGSFATGTPRDPDVAFRQDVSGDTTPGDRWVVAFAADTSAAAGQFEISATTFDSRGVGFTSATVSNFPVAGDDALDPAIVALPGVDDVAIAFEGQVAGKSEIFARRLPVSLAGTPGQTPVSTTPGTGDAFDPAITANADASQLLVGFVTARDGSEVAVQRLDFGLGKVGGAPDQVVSSAGPAGSGTAFTVGSPAVAYNPALRRYLVSWLGNDTDRPGLGNDEREVQATTLDAGGAEGTPQDVLISRSGADNDDNARVLDAAVAASSRSGRWLSVWTADDPRPPLADNEFELYGRQIGENFDVDGDGSPVPADCNDGSAGIRPGAAEVLDNGVDEDCSGADGVNLDRDGDGALRPADCDDANPGIAPGLTDVPNNDADEDCSGAARRVLTSAAIERFFKVFRRSTQVTKLRVTRAKPGMTVRVRCSPAKRKGCPKPLRGNGRTFKIQKAGAKDLTKHVRKARLKPGAVLEVRILEPGAIGRLDRFTMRKAKEPARTRRCIPFGSRTPARCS